MKVLVLGAGRVGRAIVADLVADERFEVCVADASASALAGLGQGQRCIRADLGDAARVGELTRSCDFVVGALPSSLGMDALRAVVAEGRDYVDISFMAEDPLEVDSDARRSGSTAVVDCGIAPGLSNLVLGRATKALERVESFACYVGGLPVDRSSAWEYKAPFAPYDVLAEYARPARLRIDGENVVRPAMSDIELLEIEGVGTLEAFNTDGLRTLLRTVDVPDLCEKTLRYPGHAEKVELLGASGLLGTEPMRVGDVEVSPRAVLCEALSEAWSFAAGEPDMTVFRAVLEGAGKGSRERHTFEIVDSVVEGSTTSSMARCTGFTCTAVARLVASGRFVRAGVSGPEHVGMDESCYRQVLADLEARGIRMTHRIEPA